MKKILMTSLFVALLSGCAELQMVKKEFVPANFSAKDLTGEKWLCKSSYSMWDLNTEEYYEFLPNGILLNDGKMVALKNGQHFQYKYKAKATWALDGWYLVQHLQSYELKRNFSPEAKKVLGANPEVKAWEARLFKTLITQIEQAKNMPAKREIESLTPTALTTRAHSSYEICAR